MSRKFIRATRGNLLEINESIEAKSLMTQLAEMEKGGEIELGNKEVIFTERSDGVVPEYNIRNDFMKQLQNVHDFMAREQVGKRREWQEIERAKKESAEKGEPSTSSNGTDKP